MPRFEVIKGGSASALRIYLHEGEEVKAESDALVSKTDGVDIQARVDGGFFSALARKALTNESFFLQVMRCMRASGNSQGFDESGTTMVRYDGEVLIAPAEQGDITVLNLGLASSVQSVYVASGAFLCSGSAIEIDTSMPTTLQGAGNALFSGTGFFVMKCTGHGPLALACLGSCIRYDLTVGEKRQVDNGHLVAWGESVDHRVGMATRSIFGSVASGEGLMCTFTGPGPVWIQTHKPPEEVPGHKHRPAQRGGAGGGICSKVFGCCVCAVFLVIFGSVFGYIGYLTFFGDGSWQQNGDGYRWVANGMDQLASDGKRARKSSKRIEM